MGANKAIAIMAIGAVLALTASPCLAQNASGSYLTGNALLERCSAATGSFDSGVCSGYVTGVVDAIETAQGVFGAKSKVCVPEQATIGQVRDIVKRFLDSHPAVRHMTASSLAWAAIQEAFPCSP
jgi:hypothetical protein